MAKTKKKKPQRQRPSYRKLSTVACGMLQTGSRSASPANLRSLYGVEHEDLADAPPSAPKDHAELYRMLLYVPISALSGRNIPDTAFQQAFRAYPDAVVSSFETTCPTMLSFILMGDDWDGAVTPRLIMDAIGPVERLMPEKYSNADDAAQSERHAHLQYADAFATALSDMIDWDELTAAGDLRDWSSRILSVTKTLATDERLAEMDARADEICAEAARWALSELSAWSDQADATIRSMGLLPARAGLESPVAKQDVPSMAKPNARPMPCPAGLMGSVRAAGFSVLAKQDALLPAGRIELPESFAGRPASRAYMEETYWSENREAPAWMRPVVALTHACTHKRSAELFRRLLSAGYRSEEISYAAYRTAAAQGDGLTCLASVLALCPLSTRFIHMPVIDLFSDENQFGADIVLDTHARRPAPGPCFDLIDRDDPDAPADAELRADGTSIWEAVSTASGVIPGARLRIRMGMEDDLAGMGLDPRSAAALCGYIEGARASRTHAILGTLYAPTAPNRKPVRPAVPVSPMTAEPPAPMPDEDSIRAEYESRIAAAQASATRAGTELDRAAAELRRSRKAASHEIADANSRIDGLEARNAELEAMLAKARQENARLTASVLELTLDQPDAPDGLDEDDGSGLPQWPCPVGEDCTIRFYGGHENFLAEMSRRFPNVEFSPAWKMPNTDGIAGADLILINTRSMKHKMWYSLQKAINKSGQDYILCPTRGANSCSRLILDSYAAWKAELADGVPAGTN